MHPKQKKKKEKKKKRKKKGLGYYLELCMRHMHVWFLPAKLLICDQTRMFSDMQMFFLEIYMVVYGERRQTALTVII